MQKCLVCSSKKLSTILDLGKTALANKFLTKDEINSKKEKFYSLKLCVCNDCFHVQLDNLVDPKLMFVFYSYFPSTNIFKSKFHIFLNPFSLWNNTFLL